MATFLSATRLRPSFSSLKISAFILFPKGSVFTVTRRAYSVAISNSDFFNYTSGRWAYNDAIRHSERRLVFDVDGFRRLAAQAVGRSPNDVVDITKLAEGGFNRIFLITMRDNFQMVARIPYPVTVPKYYAVASEVATSNFLRASGLPVPQVYGYSPVSDNAAHTEYIFMEFMRGTKLTDVWQELEDADVASIVRQLVQLESHMMSISFPAGGSLYYTHDLKQVAGKTVLLDDKQFCIGPDTTLHMWHGRRSKLNVDRGPYSSAKATLAAVANKERAYLEEYGRPLLPFFRIRRHVYQYKKQLPSSHIENLNRYLDIASSLVPKNLSSQRFCIRHPDLQPNNVLVERSLDGDWRVISLLDWQHTSILPLFLLAGIPQRFQNHGDPVSQSMMPPSLPEDFDDLQGNKQNRAREVYRRRLVHYKYTTNSRKYNTAHYDAFTDPMFGLRSRLFTYAGYPWEGETIDLKEALIEATDRWEALSSAGEPCPITFDAEDKRSTMQLSNKRAETDKLSETLEDMLGLGSEGWMPPSQDYEETVATCKQMKEAAIAGADSEQERAELLEHWPFDDMDEEEYM